MIFKIMILIKVDKLGFERIKYGKRYNVSLV